MTRRVAVRAIIEKDGKLLLVKLKDYESSLGEKTYWCTVGGGVDPGEDLHSAIIREVVEETGITPEVGRLLFVQQFAEPADREHLEFFFQVTNSDDFSDVDLSSTTHGETEIATIDFVDPKEAHVLPKFLREIDPASIHAQTETQFFSGF